MLSLSVECGWFLRSPGQRFDQLPSNATAMEGGSAEFFCTVRNSTMQLNPIWGFQVPGETEQHLGDRDDVKTADLKNGSTVFIGTPFNSPLTITNVTRSLDGTRVRCFFRNGILTSQDMPYAFLTVQCELFNVYTVHYSCCNIKQQTYLPAPWPQP